MCTEAGPAPAWGVRSDPESDSLRFESDTGCPAARAGPGAGATVLGAGACPQSVCVVRHCRRPVLLLAHRSAASTQVVVGLGRVTKWRVIEI